MASAERTLRGANAHQATGLQARAKRLTATALRIAISALVTVLLVEVLLYNLDPLGLMRYQHGLKVLQAAMIPTSAGYRIADGTHDAGGYVVTIDGGTRVVPDGNASADKTLVFIGDSVTFGMGVNDNETFVNLIARELADYRVVNTGYGAYNIDNIEDTRALYPDADCVVYLASANDADPRPTFSSVPYAYTPAIVAHVRLYQTVRAQQPVTYDNWLQRAERLRAGGVLVALLDHTPMADAVKNAGAPFAVLPRYTEAVSAADSHPNAAGHQQIANALLPAVRAWCQ